MGILATQVRMCVCLCFVWNAFFNLSLTSAGKKRSLSGQDFWQNSNTSKLELVPTAGQMCPVLVYIENIYFELPAHKPIAL